ncbi:MAG: hypothetical protein ABJ218_04055, partial [Winogradskyella arenosi]
LFQQDLSTMIDEAGLDDTMSNSKIETMFDATVIDFVLDETNFILTSEVNCTANIFLYKVYIHTTGLADDVILEAKTFENSGQRFPLSIPYDLVPVLGARDLIPANGTNYVVVPNNSAADAIKIFEFKGCREQIPIQFRALPSVLAAAETSVFQINYTVTATLLE